MFHVSLIIINHSVLILIKMTKFLEDEENLEFIERSCIGPNPITCDLLEEMAPALGYEVQSCQICKTDFCNGSSVLDVSLMTKMIILALASIMSKFFNMF